MHVSLIDCSISSQAQPSHRTEQSKPPPPHGLGPQVAAPIPFYLQAIGSISEVQLRIC